MRKPIAVVVNGKEYETIMDLGAAMRIQDSIGIGIQKLAKRMSEDDLRYDDIAIVLAESLKGKTGARRIAASDIMEELFEKGLQQCLMSLVMPSITLCAQFLNPESFIEREEDESDEGE